MARVTTYTCNKCRPIDTKIIEAYEILTNTSSLVSQQETDRVTAEEARVAAESQRTIVFNQDHGTAVADHGIAAVDHATASADHTAAVADHETASADHTLAVQDHEASTVATTRANNAAAVAEHMVDIHTGPAGKSAYEVAVEEGYTGTEEEWLASLKGPVGETPDISIGTVTTVEPGEPAAAAMTGTPEAPVLNLSIPQGAVGATPNFRIGTVTTGQPGTPVVITITGTAEAPVLNVQIPQGMKGDTGVSADYPITIHNGLDSDATDEALAAFQGKVLDNKISQLQQKITGIPAVNFVFSEYTEYPGFIVSGVFRSNGGYGTNNTYILIPMAGYQGRTLRFVKDTAAVYGNGFAFLKSDNLVSGEVPPFCVGHEQEYGSASGDYVVPSDCNYMYVYYARQGTPSTPTSLSIVGTDAEVCSSERADAIEGNLAAANQNIEAIGKHITLLNVNEVVGQSGTYTLAEAIDAIPQSMRRGRCILRYDSKVQSYYFPKIAFFLNNGLSGWSDTDNWIEIDIRDWSNVGESAGAFKMVYSGQTSVGANTSMRRILVPFDKMVVYRRSSDNYGRWRILVRYADGTNEFVDITADKITTITPSKQTVGFEFILMSTTETCNIDADVLIGAAETVFELTYKTDPTAESLGAVPINQGIGNAGRPLVVGADGKVAPGTATPSTVDGDSVRKVLSRELHLGADLASVTSMGTGWSGSVANGFTHASGNTDPLVLNPTTDGNAYLVTINCDTNAENLYLVSIGDGPLLDPYNGTTQQRVGIISDGGAVKITPSSSFAGTMTIKVQECVSEEDAVETVILDVYNVEAENMGAAITAFWNVAIGPDQTTLGKAVSASRNIAIGINSLLNLETGTRNIGIGTFTMSQLKNGLGNIAIGADANFLRQGGNDNIAIGRAAFGGNKSEPTNNGVFIGVVAGSQATGDNNIAIGNSSGYKAAGGCVYVGYNAGFSFTGVNNVAIGRNAGYQSGTKAGNWNTLVGPSVGIENGVSKSVAIGFQSYAEKSNQNVIGSSESVETKVFGDLVVHGTDGVDRRIMFNNDNTVTWEMVS